MGNREDIDAAMSAEEREESADKFLSIVGDVLKMRRSVCVHRNFGKLRHADWFDALPFSRYYDETGVYDVTMAMALFIKS